MTTARSISLVDSSVERGIVDKVERDGVVYRDAEKCIVLDRELTAHHPEELTSNGKALSKKIEHELVKDVIKYGKEEVFRKMMDSKMKLKLHDLIYLACLYGQKGIVDDIIQHQQRRGEFDANKDTKYGFKPIEISALNGRNDIFRLLLKNGACINYETLKNAVVGGHLETVKIVVDSWHGTPNTEEDLQGLEMRQRQHLNVDELRNRGEDSERISEFLGLSKEFLQNRNRLSGRFYSRNSII